MTEGDKLRIVRALIAEGNEVVPGFGELLCILGKTLTDQPPERRDLVLAVVENSERAYELGYEGSGILLLQVAIIMTAREECAASFSVQDTACAAALNVVRATATRSAPGTAPESAV